jgi:hypothetical protein
MVEQFVEDSRILRLLAERMRKELSRSRKICDKISGPKFEGTTGVLVDIQVLLVLVSQGDIT